MEGRSQWNENKMFCVNQTWRTWELSCCHCCHCCCCCYLWPHSKNVWFGISVTCRANKVSPKCEVKNAEITSCRDREWKINDKKNSSLKKSHKQNRIDEMTTATTTAMMSTTYSLMKRRRTRKKSDTQRLHGTVCVFVHCQRKKWTSLIFFFSAEGERASSVVLISSVAGGKSERHRPRLVGSTTTIWSAFTT